MEHFHGRLRDGDRVIFERVAGYFESGETSGGFEVHQGGILSRDLPTDHPYRLDLDDGRRGSIHLTKVHASNSAGIPHMEFGLDGDLAASPVMALG